MLARFDTTLKGLTDAEARQRLECHSRNRLREKPPHPAWMKLLDQFKYLLVIVLLGAAVLAGAIGDIKDVVVILIVVVFNTFVLSPCIGGRHRESSTPWT